MVDGIVYRRRNIRGVTAIHIHASEGYFASTKDIAQNVATRQLDMGVALHTTAGEVIIVLEVFVLALAAAKHVAVGTRKTRATNDDGLAFGLADSHIRAVQDVAFLGTAKHGGVDEAARDFHISGIHIGEGVENGARVAATATEDAAEDGAFFNVALDARHAHGAATHPDGGLAATLTVRCAYGHVGMFGVVGFIGNAIVAHVGRLVGAIHVVEDVASRDDDLGVAPHLAGVGIPF